jgi:nicotinamidase/pyrazinamidase
MKLDHETDALLVIDLQQDFLSGGALAVPGADAVVPSIARLARTFGTVVATQDYHPRGHVSFASSHPGRRPFDVVPLFGGAQVLWPDHCVAGSPGARLASALSDDAVTLILRKGTRSDVDSYSAFADNPGPDGHRRSTGLGAWLRDRGIRRVFLSGLARDYCVRASALDAVAQGFESILLDDLTRAVAPDRVEEVDRDLAAGGVRVVLSDAIEASDAARAGVTGEPPDPRD